MLGETFEGRAYLPEASYDTVADLISVTRSSPSPLALGTIL